VHGTPIRITDRRVATVGENINWVRLILPLHTIGGGGEMSSGNFFPVEIVLPSRSNLTPLGFTDFLFPPTHALNVDSWTLSSLTIGGVLLSFGIVAPMKSTVVSKLEPIVLYRGLMVSI
jgi:hypothetical protein